MVKKLLILLFILTIGLTGCWSKQELDEMAILSGVGIDLTEEEKLRLTMQVILHREMNVQAQNVNRGDQPTQNIIAEGNSLIDANRNFSLQSGRKGFWPHISVFVIGEELAKAGIEEIIDILERDHEIRRRTYLLVTRSTARDIMEAETIDLEVIQSYNISDMVEAYDTNAHTIPVDLHRYLLMTSEENSGAFITGINIIENPNIATNDNKLELKDTGIFKNHKLIGWFDIKETKGLQWIRGEVKGCIIEVEYPNIDSKVFIDVFRSSSKIKPIIQDDTIKIVVDISAEGKVAQSNSKVDLTKEQTLNELNEAAAKVMKEEAKKAIKKAQEYRVDLFGFGDAIYRKYPQTWKSLQENWDDIFRTVTIEINAKMTLKRTGLISNSL